MIEQKVIKFVNHSSVLIQDGDNFIFLLVALPFGRDTDATGAWLDCTVPPNLCGKSHFMRASNYL